MLRSEGQNEGRKTLRRLGSKYLPTFRRIAVPSSSGNFLSTRILSSTAVKTSNRTIIERFNKWNFIQIDSQRICLLASGTGEVDISGLHIVQKKTMWLQCYVRVRYLPLFMWKGISVSEVKSIIVLYTVRRRSVLLSVVHCNFVTIGATFFLII
jgi:hypothetical protein